MAGIFGADVAQLRALGKALAASSARLASTQTSLAGHVRDAGRWKGADAERFRSEWNGTHSLLLVRVAQSLQEAARAVAAHADEQERASGAAGTAGRSSTAGGPAGGDATSEYLTGGQHSVARHPDRGQANLTNTELDRLRGLVRDAASASNFFLGNDTDVNELRDALAGLKPAQLNQLLETLTDDEIRSLGSGAATDGKGLFNGEGTTPFERQELLDQLLSKASAEQVDRLVDLIPWAQPDGTAMGDAARPGGPDPSSINRWMKPDWPVIGQHPGTKDIRQGGYGDCVVLAAAGAMINADTGWAQDHVTNNGNGTVSVLLFDKNGHEQWITVTSDLPANDYGGQLGARAGFGGNWPAYVEKALAQVYTEDDNKDGTKEGTPADQAWPPGNYRAIEGNWGPDAFQYLAGPGVEQTRDAAVLWDAAEEGRPALVTTLADRPDGAPKGYYASHAYFVTGLDSNGNLLLQNPWSSEQPILTVTPQQFAENYENATVVK